jgi:hypothetical protein
MFRTGCIRTSKAHKKILGFVPENLYADLNGQGYDIQMG